MESSLNLSRFNGQSMRFRINVRVHILLAQSVYTIYSTCDKGCCLWKVRLHKIAQSNSATLKIMQSLLYSTYYKNRFLRCGVSKLNF